jgi:anion-transporting  ArsA/GET3 family ATPase
LKKQKVIVCAGSGGVGKTTVSAALGVRAAGFGRRVLVLTVDPARRLATTLGLDMSDDRAQVVPLPAEWLSGEGKLSAAVIDPKKTFDQFISKNSANPELARKILSNRLYQQLSTTLSGSQEFTALERLLTSLESGEYDLIVLDTPPTKHAMDFLTAPQRISALFQDSITKWFVFPSAGSGLLSGLLQRGTRTVLKSLEILTGGQFIEELIDFFASVRSIQTVLRDRSESVRAFLTSEKTKFILVTSFDAAKLNEARYLQGELGAMGYSLGAVVINRAFPIWLPEQIADAVPADSETYKKVLGFYQQFREYYAIRYRLYEAFAEDLKRKVSVVRIPEYDQDVHGLTDLRVLAEKLSVLGE